MQRWRRHLYVGIHLPNINSRHSFCEKVLTSHPSFPASLKSLPCFNTFLPFVYFHYRFLTPTYKDSNIITQQYLIKPLLILSRHYHLSFWTTYQPFASVTTSRCTWMALGCSTPASTWRRTPAGWSGIVTASPSASARVCRPPSAPGSLVLIILLNSKFTHLHSVLAVISALIKINKYP